MFWRPKFSGVQSWFQGEIDQAYPALTGTGIAMGGIVVSQPQRAVNAVSGILPGEVSSAGRAFCRGDIDISTLAVIVPPPGAANRSRGRAGAAARERARQQRW